MCSGSEAGSYVRLIDFEAGSYVRLIDFVITGPCPLPTVSSIFACTCTRGYTSQCKSNCFTEMCSGSEAGSYLRLIDVCISQL